MYNKETLYYLQQLGIRPWIKKGNPVLLSEPTATANRETLKLIVVLTSTLSDKTHALLQQMMSYIHLNEHELAIISVQEEQFQHRYDALVSQQPSLGILSFGFNQENQAIQQYSHIPRWKCRALDALIANPFEKKNVFKVLSEMKQLVC